MTSSRRRGVPAIFQSFGSLSLMSFGAGIRAAALAMRPKLTVRPLGTCVMTPFSARHSAAATFHLLAAAAISISRAVAPALRSSSCDARIERLPPVDMSPQARLRRRLSAGGTNSALTLLQSHSSSSATSIGSAVKLPWPISERATRMITVSSGWITIQAVISGATSPASSRSRPERDVEAERQRAADRGDAGEERAAVERRDRAHGVCSALRALSSERAAAWIAARIR